MLQVITAAALQRLVSAKRLKSCALWRGSTFESAFQYGGGITVTMLAEKYNSLSACDDRTPLEEEWLTAIKETLADAGFIPVVK